MSKNKQKSKPNFTDYYQDLFRDRWNTLQEALQSEPVYSTIQFSERTPYYLDQASEWAATALGVQPGDEVLDMCAAPGGKSLIFARALAGKGLLQSNDRSAARRQRLQNVLQQTLPAEWHSTFQISGHDASRWGIYEQDRWDRIFLDAPCSSERHVLNSPEHIKQWSPSRSKRLATQQFAMLASALTALKPGGTLIYCTCALDPQENDGVWDKLHKKRAGLFEAIPPQELLNLIETRNCKHLAIGSADKQDIHALNPAACSEFTRHGLQFLPDKAQGRGPIWLAGARKIWGFK